MIVCHCNRVSHRAVEAAIASGATTVGEVTRRSRAGGGCGSCCPSLEALLARLLDGADQAVDVAA